MSLEWIDDPKFIRKILSKEEPMESGELGEVRDLVQLLRKQNKELREKLEVLEKPVCSHHFP